MRAATLMVVALTTMTALAADREPIRGANYPLANKFNREFVSTLVHEVSVSPQWIGKTDRFWYQIRTPEGVKFWKVDPAMRSKTPLFDAVKVAAQLSTYAKKPLEVGQLTLNRPRISDDGAKFTFTFGENLYELDLATSKLTDKGKAPTTPGAMTPEAMEQLRQRLGDDAVREMQRRLEERNQQDNTQQQQQQQQDNQQQQQPPTPPTSPPTAGYKAQSPDKKWYLYAFKHNLYLAEEGKEDQAVQLTKDGVEDYSFSGGGFGGGGGRGLGGGTQQQGTQQPPATDRKTRPNVTWSPDSAAFYVQRTDSRGVKDLYLVDSIANPRPRLEQYKYPMPGEESVRKSELFVGTVAAKSLTKITPKWKDERYGQLAWGKTAEELRFVRRDRLQRNLEVCIYNAKTNACQCQILEGFESAYLEYQPPRLIEETGEYIWWSERSGWGHYYLYGKDGKLKNAITAGDWRASRIVELDPKNRVAYIAGNGRVPSENIYFQHLYRVNFDGTDLTCLDPSVRVNAIGGESSQSQPIEAKTDPMGFNQTSYLSPTKKYVVTTSSRVDHAPFATVRDDSGRAVMLLESTDLTRLQAAGWKMPQTFTVKAADGITELYGNMWLPFDFDPNKKYPIIANVYPGPQTEGVTHRFQAYSPTMQLAQLGFVVIQVGHRGGTPERSKAYHSFGYFNLRDYGLVDKKAAIEQLASRFPFIELSKVGIYGHSGGGFMSAAALLQPPYNTFFTAAVASAGNHDNNIYNDNWSERYHGMKEVPDTGERNATQNAGGSGRGFGGQGGRGRTRPPEIDLDDLDLDPDDQRSTEEQVRDIEKKIAALQQQIAEARKAETKVDDKKAETKTETKTETKAEEKKTEAKPAVKTKFEIKVPTNSELAANLKGHLLLVHGEVDNNVHPANTMRLVDALIKANKRFDLLIIPGARHGFGPAQPYFTQKMWDFFGEHLLDDRQTNANILEKDVKRK